MLKMPYSSVSKLAKSVDELPKNGLTSSTMCISYPTPSRSLEQASRAQRQTEGRAASKMRPWPNTLFRLNALFLVYGHTVGTESRGGLMDAIEDRRREGSYYDRGDEMVVNPLLITPMTTEAGSPPVDESRRARPVVVWGRSGEDRGPASVRRRRRQRQWYRRGVHCWLRVTIVAVNRRRVSKRCVHGLMLRGMRLPVLAPSWTVSVPAR